MAESSLARHLVSEKTAPTARALRGLHRYTLFAGLLIAFTGVVTFVAPTDRDVWWHLSNGKLILESGLPARDVYSFTAEGRPWLVQEWLTEVVMYQLKSAFGYSALSLLFGLLQALGAALAYALVRRMGAGRVLSLLLLMLYTLFAASSWGVRPQVLTPLFLGIFYLALLHYRDEPGSARPLMLLPPLMALWTNLHASYFMGIALLGAFLVGELANNYLHRPARPVPLRPLFATLVACFAATLLNPYFLELWSYPLTYLLNGTSNPLLRYTQEWKSPDFREPINLLFGLSIVLLGLVGLARPAAASERQEWRVSPHRHLDVTLAIVLVAFTFLALQAVRLVPLYGLMVLPLLGGAFAAAWPCLSSRDEAPASGVEGKLNWVMALAGVTLIAYSVLNAPQAQVNREPRADTAFAYPVTAAAYLEENIEPVRLYNNFAWGGYLIYRLYPRHKVFIDGRADMYREGIFEDFITVQEVRPGWREVLSRYNITHTLIVPGGSLDYALSRDPGWKVVFKDRVSVIYRKIK